MPLLARARALPPAEASLDRLGGSPGPLSGRGVPQLERCLLRFSLTPRAWSCCFQEEELRGTSRGSGAARGARLSSAPSLLALPRLPWLSRSLGGLQRTGGREVSWPQSRWTPLPTPAPPAPTAPPASLLRLERRGIGKGRPIFLLPWATLETLKKC
jgi:hypothetical protein